MQNENNYILFVILSGVIAMGFAFWKASWINSQKEGNERMKTIGASIADGAMAFLRAEYRILSIFVFIFALGTDAQLLKTIGIGIIWSLLLLSSTLSLRKFYEDDFNNGIL